MGEHFDVNSQARGANRSGESCSGNIKLASERSGSDCQTARASRVYGEQQNPELASPELSVAELAESYIEIQPTVSVSDACGRYYSQEVYPSVGAPCLSVGRAIAPLGTSGSIGVAYTRCQDGTSSTSLNLGLGVPGCDLFGVSAQVASGGIEISIRALGTAAGLSIRPGPLVVRYVQGTRDRVYSAYGALDHHVQRVLLQGHF